MLDLVRAFPGATSSRPAGERIHGDTHVGDTHVVRFGHVVEAPRQARRFAAERLAHAGHEDLRPAVELLVSELVTNVIRHTANGGTLCIDLREDGLRIEVTDDAVHSDLCPSRPDDAHASGRGLFILDSAASRWGVRYPDPHHKSVWFEVEYCGARDDP